MDRHLHKVEDNGVHIPDNRTLLTRAAAECQNLPWWWKSNSAGNQ